MNEVLKTIERRSSIRAYANEKLTEEEIKALITAGLQAPTARNMQEVHISVVDGDNPLVEEIEQEKRRVILSSASEEAKKSIADNPNNFCYNAPTLFILSVDKDFKWSKVDAGIAAENISLAAESMGLGSLIIGIIDDAMKGDKKDYFAKAFKFPDNFEFAIAVAAGRKSAGKEPHEINFDKSVSFI